jgi:alkanesulfonate monooxygenase SsuD/methylene tetrahydromethanopterin reductase-like flavin-dependent oxidoreductase (luciferase family)
VAWPLRFGIRTGQFGGAYQDILACWQAADELGFDTAWVNDHFVGVDGTRGQRIPVSTRSDEAWTLLSALLANTRRVRGGIMVSGNTFRHPALVAHMARTIDQLSAGRLEFGFGVGWTVDEHAMFGWELPPVPQRVRWFDEACTLIKRLWTEPEVTFMGERYQLTRAVLEPKPVQRPYPHFVVGASGEQLTIRAAARHADEWNYRLTNLETYRRKVDALDRHMQSFGRDPASIQRSASFSLGAQQPAVDQLAAVVCDYIALGLDHVVFLLKSPFRAEQVSWLWRELIPAIRDRAGR